MFSVQNHGESPSESSSSISRVSPRSSWALPQKSSAPSVDHRNKKDVSSDSQPSGFAMFVPIM